MSFSVGCTTTRPIACVSSSPIGCQLSPPSVLLKMPPPGEMELRESSSPVPAQIVRESLGAMARSPIETTRSWSQIGRKVTPWFVVFQIPPAAAAM